MDHLRKANKNGSAENASSLQDSNANTFSKTKENGSKAFKLLIVEDNALLQMSLEEMLKGLGHTAEFASDAKEALKKYNSSYDFILMDIEMPILTGIELSQIIRAIEKNNQLKHVPIIAVTTHHDEPEYQEKCFQAGMNAIYGKLNQAQLSSLISEYTV